ncbi:hypothetical protein COEREDRAFT_9583 [Coemansia reversa NRRL 1564]|uniref:Uncharacterized protein n=1 Tax=Coemansia reversa (strain ATCC 12441 / NRRL 1564) TaxID=763665 RepID=A0A2G5B864_COERN|nr:hypothetical protein COEREDRAFT_9583 [Coemansia reversa NRRL 1564]|eukprot:PIA15195.1 hypothetical protein COEREDRAFT_9583 [Coemansia reversa NRRL 1564]
MKLSIASIVLAATVVVAQYDTNTLPETEGTPTVEEPMYPAVQTPADMPKLQMGYGSDTESLLSRLASYFDLTHVASDITTMPVTITKLYDPASNKFTVVSANVMQSGGAYYVPVCPTNAIVSAGQTPVMDVQPAACGYGIQLTPVPNNAANAMHRVIRTAYKAIMSIGRPSFMGMNQSTGMQQQMMSGSGMMQPGSGMMQQMKPGMMQQMSPNTEMMQAQPTMPAQ